MKQAGNIDFFTVDLLTGWAWDPQRPDEPVDVAVLDEGRTVMQFKADRYRRDLEEAGIGNGRHAFSLKRLYPYVPWSRRNLSVVRMSDGAALASDARSLIATGSPHLFLTQGCGTLFIAFGEGLFEIAAGSRFGDLAAWLPITLPASTDDALPRIGTATWKNHDWSPTLLLEPINAPPFEIQIDRLAVTGPHVRICRGRGRDGKWLGPEVTLEVENAIGVELLCSVPKQDGLDSKTIHVRDSEGVEQCFELPRGRRTPISIRITRTERHRLDLWTQPEADGENGVLLCGIDVIGGHSGPTGSDSGTDTRRDRGSA